MTPDDAWRDQRAATEIQCREARADERRRICAYLRELGGWAAAAAAAVEGDDYWRHERAELLADRRAPDNSHATNATDHTSPSAGDPQEPLACRCGHSANLHSHGACRGRARWDSRQQRSCHCETFREQP